MRDYTDIAFKFALGVIKGKIAAPQTVVQACQRFQRDLERSQKKWLYHYDSERAEKVCAFLEQLPHVKGRWAAKKERLVLSDWQVFATANLYGWVDRQGSRRFRYSMVLVPRKNGKSFWIAGIGNYHLVADEDYGAEVYCGATSEKQAWEVFRPAREMWRKDEELRNRYGVQVNAKTLCVISEGNRFEPVIGNPGDGPAPSCAIVDEYHEHSESHQYDTFDTGLGSRDQPFLHVVTTAGSSLGGPCYERYQECRKILDGEIEDETTFVLIYEPDKEDRWDDPEVLRKVNPNYGVSVSADYLLNQLKQARNSSSKQNAYRTKHLNEWVGARTAWMNMLRWQACKRKLVIEDCEDDPCYITLDLSKRVDMACVGAVFKHADLYRAFVWAFVPEGALERGDKRIPADKYRQFQQLPNFFVTEGDAVSYSVIEDHIFDLFDHYQALELLYDGWQAEYLAQRLREPSDSSRSGIEAVEFRHTVQNLSEPMKETEALVVSGKLQHSGDPLLTWGIGNVRSRVDLKENEYPVKESKDSPAKIDPAVCVIMGVGGWLRDRDQSYLESSDLLVL